MMRTTTALLLACVAVRLTGQPPAITEAEALQPPTAQRIAALHAAAQREGWAAHAVELRRAALQAYEHDNLTAAEKWLYLYRWAQLFGERARTGFLPRWVEAVNAARVGHANMPASMALDDRPLGEALSPELQAWLLGNAAFTDEFFSVLSPVDFLPAVFRILDELHRLDPAAFKKRPNLALAIAIVYDVAPPPTWPHGQVPVDVLPRRFPAPAEAFAWWSRQEQLGRTYQPLSRLGADELKFVVDVSATFPELEWAQKTANLPLAQLAGAYTMVRYRNDRAAGGVALWPGRSYRLPDILAAGGICADQAYFATQVGKARGVPTLLFYGAGNDGRHAWFGFLKSDGKWELDAGRYAEQRFVTGYARDPQTWGEFSDHELKFLSEHFRQLPSYRRSRVHGEFAAGYLAAGDAVRAGAAARKAVNFERRNQEAWDILVEAASAAGRDAAGIEALWREAILAFRNYPDLETLYVNRVAESLYARGQTSAAEAELRRIAHRNENSRSDLSTQEARNIVMRSIATQIPAEQIRRYNAVVDSFGAGAGIGFFDQVVTPFVSHLLEAGLPADALRAVERARGSLKVEPRSQLDTELEQLRRRAADGVARRRN
jgi:hypothetical protein